MALTQNSYTGNGSTVLFNFTFPYLQEADVKVKLDGVTQATSAYSFANATTIQMGTAPGNGVTVLIFRDTNNDAKKATFYPGSAIKAEDLNDDFDQILYVAQEVDNYAMTTLGDDEMIGDFKMGSNRIIFEGATANEYETFLTVADPTADRTITLPNVTGTVITTGDTGTITSSMIEDGTFTDADINANAAIAGTKINLVTTSVQGVMSAADKTKLNAIESNATADQTATEIKTLYEQNSDTNAFTDADHSKLDAIEAGATGDQTNAEIRAAVEAATDSNVFTDADHTKLNAIEAGATGDQTASEIRTLVESASDSNVFTDADHTKLDNIETAATADQTASEIKALIASSPLDASHLAPNSVTTSEIADAELTTLAGMQTGTASILASSTALAATTAEINTICDGKTVQTTISDTDASYPTSGAVVDYVAAQIAPLGGLEVIANEDSFPTTQPQSGVVISIADAGGIVVNGSGVSTTARTSGNGSDNVTINGFPSSLYSTTLSANLGLMVSSTGSSNTYTYHKLLGKEDDIKQLSDDINDFNARYRVAASAPSSSLDDGDLWFDTTNNEMKVYNATGSSWDVVTSVGDFNINTISSSGNTGGGSATFNGTAYRFVLSNPPTSAQQLIVSVNGVIQKPNAGSSQPSEGFAISGNDIIFAAAPPSGADYFITTQGSSVSVGTPSDNTVSTAKIQNLAVTGDKIATNLDIADNKKIRFGTGNDLEIYHDINDSYITNTGVGNLIIRGDDVHIQGSNGDNMANFNEDGGVQLRWDGTTKFETTSVGVKVTGNYQAVDGYHIYLGTGNDLDIVHDGTNSRLRNTTGQLQLRSDIIAFENAAGSDSATIQSHLDLPDNYKVKLGTGDDLQLYHDGGSSYISNTTGNLYIEAKSGATAIQIIPEGATDLRYDGSKKVETTSYGAFVTGTLKTDTIDLDDDKKIQLGDTDDFRLWHDGSTNIIEGQYHPIELRHGSDIHIKCVDDGAVSLYEDNTLKFLTGTAGDYGSVEAKTGKNAWDGFSIGGYYVFMANIQGDANTAGIYNDLDNEWMWSGARNGDSSLYYDGNRQLYTYADGVVVGSSTETDANLRIDHENSGGIGRLEVNSHGSANIQLISNFSGSAVNGVPDGTFGLSTPHSKDIHFCTAGTSRMTITSDGTWRYNTTSDSPDTTSTTGMSYASSKLRVSRSADPCAAFNRANSTGDVIQLNYNGTQRGSISTDGTVIAFNTSSDYRLKENEVAISDGITRLKTLKPYRFNFISNPSKTVDGFFAHEVTAVPEAITGEKDGAEMQGMDYSKLTPLLTAALQEAITKIETLETKVAALEAK